MNRFHLHIPPRISTAAPVGHATLFLGDRSIVIDERNLPGQLARLIPPAYAHAPEAAWRPFIVLAEAMGLVN